MTIKQQLSLELESAPPEVQAQVYEFLQFLKKNRRKSSEGKTKTHFLSDLAGSIAPEDGEGLAAIVNREFQNIGF